MIFFVIFYWSVRIHVSQAEQKHRDEKHEVKVKDLEDRSRRFKNVKNQNFKGDNKKRMSNVD